MHTLIHVKGLQHPRDRMWRIGHAVRCHSYWKLLLIGVRIYFLQKYTTCGHLLVFLFRNIMKFWAIVLSKYQHIHSTICLVV